MKKYFILSLLTSAIVTGGALPTLTCAQEATPGHPRVNKIEQRINNQENRINAEEQSGKITADQAARDQKRLDKEKAQLTTDEAEHGGHITKGEERQLNREANHN